MKPFNPLLAACLLAAAAPVLADGPATTGALATPANRIIGVWANESHVGPCGGPVGGPGYQTLLFNAGGTMVDNSRSPPAGIPAVVNGVAVHLYRTIGVGTWSYSPESGEYALDQQFYWFVDSQYDGYQTVHRTILLSADGNQAGGAVLTRRYAANGALITELCGTALSNRL